MSSVWKRIQRVGKRASKFQFIASYQTLTLECSRDGKWQPNKLSVVWTRRNRRKAVKPETWQPSIANPFRGMIVWTDPEEVEISVTLYKDAREGSPFEDKLWTFVIEDEAISGKRRPVASVSVNMVDYHSVDLKTFCLNLPLRPASKKVISASLELNLACVLLKEGNATDEDMISMSSLLSLNDPYGGLREFDHDQPSGKNFKRNAGKRLSLRSAKSKNKPTFNMASSTDSPKVVPKKNAKNKGKSQKNDVMNTSLPAANHVTVNGLNKPMSTSDTDISKIENRSSFQETKKEEQLSAPEESLLKWCRDCMKDYPNVTVTNMTTSWRNGMAFCAIIHHFNPDMIDFSSLKPDNIRENNRLAFEAFDYLGISRMLDPHQMVLSSVPDKLLIMTYLHQIKQYFTTRKTTAENDGQDDDVTLATIVEAERSLRMNTEALINDIENNDFTKLKNRVLSDVKTDTSKGDLGKTEYEANPGYNPFEEDEPKTDTSKCDLGKTEYEANTGYNPFEEDEPIAEDVIDIEIPQEKSVNVCVNTEDVIDSKVNKKDDNEQSSPCKTTSEKSEINSGQSGKIDRIKHEKRQVNMVKETKQGENKGQESQNSLERPQKRSQNQEEITDPWKLATNADKIDSPRINKKHNSLENHEKADVKDKKSLHETDKPISKDLDNVPKKPERLDIKDNKSLQESTVLYSPKPGYNPFLEEEIEELASRTEDTEKSLNPFDEDYKDDIDKIDIDKIETAQTNTPKSLNPFDDDYEETFETDLDEVLGENNVVKNVEVDDAGRGLEGNGDKRLGTSNVDEVMVARSPRTISSRPQTTTDNSPSRTNITKDKHNDDDNLQNNVSSSPVRRRLARTTNINNTSSVARSTENIEVSQMHRKEIRRPVERPSTLPSKPPMKKQLTESQIKLKRPESENLGRKGTPTSPTPARGQLSLPTSPRSRIPSFEEWKAKKSDDVAKQEKLKAQARQMIKEARAKNSKSQNVSSTGQEGQDNSVSSRIPVPASASLPRLTTSKKYRAPEPPSVAKQGNLASKLKDEIEYQKKITEKTRKTLESSRIKRINPKQENVPEIEQRRERSEKVKQAIKEAREKPNKKIQNPETTTDSSADDVSKAVPETIRPPKPPRVYTYTEETGAEERVEPQETGEENAMESQENVDNDPANSSLQQNPFKLTFKKKEALPQAVVKPLSSTIGRETKIDLKKYSIKSRTLPSETIEKRSTGGENRGSGQLSDSQESLTDQGQISDEEDVNDILDNVGDESENESKTDEELYDNGEDEEGFQDTSQYVEHEIAVLEEDRIALDRVAVKLEKELREAMNTADCKDEEQRLFQEWFLLVNKRNEIVRRQTELSILEKEEDLEKRFELLNRELRFLMADNNREKTAQEKKREELLLAELVRLVDKRDELVRIEDSQVQEAEKAAQHVEHIVKNTKIPKKQADCSIQ